MPTTGTIRSFIVFAWVLPALLAAGGCRSSEGPAGQVEPAAESGSAVAATVATDGFPAGPSTPEGVACDFARAFIRADAALFRAVSYPARADTETHREYRAFIEEVVAEIERASEMPAHERGGPASIGTVYRARDLSLGGGASYGYAVMGLTGVMFVDVLTPLHDGRAYVNRTLVVQAESSGLWYVIPRPDLFPLLSRGLNAESASVEVWTAE